MAQLHIVSTGSGNVDPMSPPDKPVKIEVPIERKSTLKRIKSLPIFERLDGCGLRFGKKWLTASHLHWNEKNLAKYESERLYMWGFMCLFTGTSISFGNIVGTLISCGMATVLGYYNCEAISSPANGWKICIPTSNNEALVLSSLAAFLVSMFVSQIFQRWWETRKLLQLVIGGSNGLAVLVSTYVIGNDEEVALARKTMVRYANLLQAFVYLQAYDSNDVTNLLDRGLLNDEEWAILKPIPGRTNVISGWMSSLLRELAQGGHVFNHRDMVVYIQDQISRIRAGAADIGMYLGCQIPYSYTHLVALIIKVHLALFMLYSASLIGTGFAKKQAERVIMGYIVNIITTILFTALLELHARLENPFGKDAQDFPSNLYLSGNERSTNALISTALPSAVTRHIPSHSEEETRSRGRRGSRKSSDEGVRKLLKPTL